MTVSRSAEVCQVDEVRARRERLGHAAGNNRVARIRDVVLDERRDVELRGDRRRVGVDRIQESAAGVGVGGSAIRGREIGALTEIGIVHRATVDRLGKAVCRNALVEDRNGVLVLRAHQDGVRDTGGAVRAVVEAVDVELLACGVGQAIEQSQVDLVDHGSDRHAVDRAVQGQCFRRISERIDDLLEAPARGFEPIGPVQQTRRVAGALIVGDVFFLDRVERFKRRHLLLLENQELMPGV